MADNLKGIKFPNYFKNVSKSVLYTASDIVKDKVPAVTSYSDTNSEVTRATIDSVKNINRTMNIIKKKVNDAPVTKDVKDLLKNAMSDLKTGNLHNKKRMEASDIFNLGGDWSDDDFDSSFGDMDDGETHTSKTSKKSGDGKTSINVINHVMKSPNFQKQSQVQVNLTKAQMANADKNAFFANSVSTKLHEESMNEYRTMNDNIGKLISFGNDNLNPLIERTNKYFDESITEHRRQVALLQELAEMQKISLQSHFRQQKEEKESDHDRVLKNGAIDIKEFGKVVGRNANEYIQDQMGIDLSFLKAMGGNPLKEIAASPWSFAIKQFVTRSIPTFFNEAVKDFNKSVEGFGTAMFMKMDDWKKSDNPLFSILGNILGLKSKNYSIDTSAYEKGPIPFDGVTKKAITDVIPTLLSKIHSAVAGLKDEMVMDYDSGKLQWKSQKEKELRDMSNSAGMMDMSGFTDKIDSYLEAFSFKDEREEKDFQDGIEQSKRYIRDLGSLFNPKSASHRDTFRRNITNRDSADFMMAIFDNMTKSELNALPMQSHNAKVSKNNMMKSMNESASGNGFVQMKMSDNVSQNVHNVDQKNTNKMYKLVDTIRRTLIQGIVVYPHVASAGSVSGLDPELQKVLNDRRKSEIDLLGNESFEKQRREQEAKRKNETRNKNMASIERDARKSGRTIADFSNINSPEEFAQLLRTAQVTKKATDKKTEDDSMFGEIKKDSKGFFEKIQEIVKSPFQSATNLIKKADEKIFELIYGADSKEGQKKGLVKTLFEGFEKKTNDIWSMIKSKVLDKIIDKLGDEEKGLVPTMKNIWNTGFLSPVREVFNSATDSIFGTKGTDGKRGNDGVLSPIKTEFKNMFSSMNEFLIGGEKLDKDGNVIKPSNPNSVMANIKSQFSGITGGFKNYLFGKEHLDANGNPINDGKGLFSQIGTGLKTSFDLLGVTLFGKESSDGSNKFEGLKSNFKKFLPTASTGAAVGLIGSIFLPGGPLIGAMLGAGLNIARKTGRLDEILFGKTDENGYKKGIFHESLKEKLKSFGFTKENAPKMVAGGALGLVGSMFLPGGPLIGAMIGSGAALVASNDKLKETLFGKIGEDGKVSTKGIIPKSFVEAFPQIKIGAGVGVLGSLFLPGGPITGAILGGTIGWLNKTDSFQRFLWGDYDKEKGTGKHGILYNSSKFFINQITKPFKLFFGKQFAQTSKWMQKSIFGPLKFALTPVGTEIKHIFKTVGKSITGFFTKAIGTPLTRLMDTKLLRPLRNALTGSFNILFKAIRGIVGSPFKLIGAFSEHLVEKQLARGDISAEDIIKRNQQQQDYYKSADDKYDERMTNHKADKKQWKKDVRDHDDERKREIAEGKAQGQSQKDAKKSVKKNSEVKKNKAAMEEAKAKYGKGFLGRLFESREAKATRQEAYARETHRLRNDGEEINDRVTAEAREEHGLNAERNAINTPKRVLTLKRQEKMDGIIDDSISSNNLEKGQEIGKNVVEGIKKGIQDNRKSLSETVLEMTDEDIINAIEKRLDIRSPSRRLRQTGSDAIAGLKEGIVDKKQEVYDEMGEVGQGMVDNAEGKSKKSGFLSKMGGKAKDSVQYLFSNRFRKRLGMGIKYSLLGALTGNPAFALMGLASGLNGGIAKSVKDIGKLGFKGLGMAFKAPFKLAGMGIKGVKKGFKLGRGAFDHMSGLKDRLKGSGEDQLVGNDHKQQESNRQKKATEKAMKDMSTHMETTAKNTGLMAKMFGMFKKDGFLGKLLMPVLAFLGKKIGGIVSAIGKVTGLTKVVTNIANWVKKMFLMKKAGDVVDDLTDGDIIDVDRKKDKNGRGRRGNTRTSRRRPRGKLGKIGSAIGTGFSNFGTKIKDVGGKVFKRKGVQAGASGASAAATATSFSDKFVGMFKSPKLTKILGAKNASKVAGLASKIATKIPSMGIKSILKSPRFIPGVGIALVAADLASGAADADNIFGVSSEDVTPGMRVAGSVARAISSLTLGLVSEDYVGKLAYGLFAGKEGRESIDAKQKAFGKKAAAVGLDSKTYNEIENQSTLSKVGNFFHIGKSKTQKIDVERKKIAAEIEKAYIEGDYEKANQLKAKLDNLDNYKSKTKDSFQIEDIVVGPVKMLGKLFNEHIAGTKVGKMITGLGDGISNVFGSIGSFLSEKASEIWDGVSDVGSSVAKKAKGAWGKTKSWASNTWGNVKDAFSWAKGGPNEGLINPVDSSLPVTSKFGNRKDPFGSNNVYGHKGTDIGAPEGEPIRAVSKGKIVKSEKQGAYGNVVDVDHGDGYISRYAHAKQNHVKVGDLVKAGQKISEVGSTGKSTGPHLHFEMRKNGEAIDSSKLVNNKMGAGAVGDSNKADDIVNEAKKYIGANIKYSQGSDRDNLLNGKGKTADCSSFSRSVIKKATGVDAGTYSKHQWSKNVGTVNRDYEKVKGGDLVFIDWSGNGAESGIGHVGISTGNNGEYIDHGGGKNGTTPGASLSKYAKKYFVGSKSYTNDKASKFKGTAGKPGDETSSADGSGASVSKDPMENMNTLLSETTKFFTSALFGKSYGGLQSTDSSGDSSNSSGGSGGINYGSPDVAIGALARKYETSNKGPGMVSSGAGDYGGRSYGSYQFPSYNKPSNNTVTAFVDWTKSRSPEIYKRLKNAGGVNSGTFVSEWEKIGKEKANEFLKLQHDYTAKLDYFPAVSNIKKSSGVDFTKKDITSQAVLWSTATQHGGGGANRVFTNAGVNNNTKPKELIDKVYSERGSGNGSKYFPSSSASVQQGVASRFKREKVDADSMYAKYGDAKGGPNEAPMKFKQKNQIAESTSKIQASIGDYHKDVTEKIQKTMDADSINTKNITGGDVPWDEIIRLLESIDTSSKSSANATAELATNGVRVNNPEEIANVKLEQSQNNKITRVNDNRNNQNAFLGRVEDQRQKTVDMMRQKAYRVASGD